MKTKKYIFLMINTSIVWLLSYFYFDYLSAIENEKRGDTIKYWSHLGELALQIDTLSDTAYSKEYCNSILNKWPEPVRTVVRNVLNE